MQPTRQQSPFWRFFFRKPVAWQLQTRQLLSQTTLFDDIPSSVLMQLIEGMYYRQYQDKESVFNYGEPGLGMYSVLSGSVEIFFDDQILATIGAGEFFGEDGLRAVVSKHATGDAQTLMEQIHGAVQDFAQGQPLADDLTLIVIKVESRGSSLSDQEG